MDATIKEGRWKWLRTLTHDELAAIELSDEERAQFNCPLKKPAVVASKSGGVLCLPPLKAKAIADASVNMWWENIDGKMVGPFVSFADVVKLAAKSNPDAPNHTDAGSFA